MITPPTPPAANRQPFKDPCSEARSLLGAGACSGGYGTGLGRNVSEKGLEDIDVGDLCALEKQRRVSGSAVTRRLIEKKKEVRVFTRLFTRSTR